jgi:hypothetical protein
MSFYQGNVVKLIYLGNDHWQVASVYFLDTDCDQNIHTNFIQGNDTRAVIIPADVIVGFDANTTTHIESMFDAGTGTETWAAT